MASFLLLLSDPPLVSSYLDPFLCFSLENKQTSMVNAVDSILYAATTID